MSKYLEFKKGEEGMELILKPEASEEAKALLEEYKNGDLDQYDLFIKLADTSIGKEIEMIHPSKVGHFLEGVILGTDVSFDEEGEILETDDSTYYCYPDQENSDPFEKLFEEGKVLFVIAE